MRAISDANFYYSSFTPFFTRDALLSGFLFFMHLNYKRACQTHLSCDQGSSRNSNGALKKYINPLWVPLRTAEATSLWAASNCKGCGTFCWTVGAVEPAEMRS